MKSILTGILVLATAGSLGYGYYQQSKLSEVASELEAANARAHEAEEQAKMQMMMAQAQSSRAEMEIRQSEEARLRAEQAVLDCQKRKK